MSHVSRCSQALPLVLWFTSPKQLGEKRRKRSQQAFLENIWCASKTQGRDACWPHGPDAPLYLHWAARCVPSDAKPQCRLSWNGLLTLPPALSGTGWVRSQESATPGKGKGKMVSQGPSPLKSTLFVWFQHPAPCHSRSPSCHFSI